MQDTWMRLVLPLRTVLSALHTEARRFVSYGVFNLIKNILYFFIIFSFLLWWTLSYNKLAQSDSFLCRSHLLWDHLHLLWKHYMHHDWVRVNLIFNDNEIVLRSVENCTWRRMIDGMGGWGYFQAHEGSLSINPLSQWEFGMREPPLAAKH